jgi:3-phenylpropionate/trans-cinnamate dioxygenase ferredoxin subunit
MTAELIKIAKTDDIADGRVKVYTAGGKRIAVCNVGGAFYAVADLCTHDGGPLGEGELVDHQIECPRHGARFDIETGKAMCLPAVLPITTYKVEERDGDLWVGIAEGVPS